MWEDLDSTPSLVKEADWVTLDQSFWPGLSQKEIGGRTGVSDILSPCTKGGIKINYGN